MTTIPEVVMAQSLQITNTPDVLPDLQGRSHSEQSKQFTVVINHLNHPMKPISLTQLQWFSITDEVAKDIVELLNTFWIYLTP